VKALKSGGKLVREFDRKNYIYIIDVFKCFMYINILKVLGLQYIYMRKIVDVLLFGLFSLLELVSLHYKGT
jgi:hypothetical protein